MTDYIELWAEEHDWFHAIVKPFTDLLSEPGVLLMVGAMYFIAVTWYAEDIRPASVVILLYAGVFVFGAPGPVAIVFGAIATVGVSLAYMSVYGLRRRR